MLFEEVHRVVSYILSLFCIIMDTTAQAPFTIAASQPVSQVLYFAYGSNMWEDQMYDRCPNSSVAGMGRLKGYRWIINKRGYANIVTTEATEGGKQPYDVLYTNIDECVYGMVYLIAPEDEARLDVHEGVPFAYTKEIMTAEFWPFGPPDPSPAIPSKKRDMLVYIDRNRTNSGLPQKEYIDRMNYAIRDLEDMGSPLGYTKDVLRPRIPLNKSLNLQAEKKPRRMRGFPAKEEVLVKEALPTTGWGES